MKFEELISDQDILKAIDEMGFESPTEIQEKGIALINKGGDVIGQSQTGTGKTAAFTIPVLEKMDPNVKKPQVLILCPTRELSVQVAGEFRKIAKYMPNIRSTAVYGGEPIYKQINAIKKGAQVIVGTPGRLIDHLNRRTLRFDALHTIIMDEADEMLKMGFREDIEFILASIEGESQKILFSATMPKPIIELAEKYLDNPGSIKIKSKGLTTSTVEQQYCAVKAKYKSEALFRLLDAKAPERCIVFCNTKRQVDDITDELQKREFWSDKIHGDLKQELRLAVLDKFNNGVINVMVATDVAARGLDIQNVDLVINYDIPEKEDYYVHRIGRSGRAGKDGEAITLASFKDRFRLHAVERYIQKRLKKISVPSIKEVNDTKKENFIDDLMENMNQDVLDHYEPVIEKILEKGYSLELLAATLLKDALTLHELIEDTDLNDHDFNQRRRPNDNRDNSRRGNNRGRSNGSRDGRDAGDNNRRGQNNRGGKAKRSGQTRLFLSVGKAHQATVKDILGAITGEAKVNGRSIGAIDMYDRFSFVDIDDKNVDKVVNNLMNKRIKGRIVNIEVAKS